MPIVVGNDIGPMAGVAAFGGSQAAEREKWKRKYLEMLEAQGKAGQVISQQKKPVKGWTNVFGGDLSHAFGDMILSKHPVLGDQTSIAGAGKSLMGGQAEAVAGVEDPKALAARNRQWLIRNPADLGLVDSKGAAARLSGMSDEQVNKYMEGLAKAQMESQFRTKEIEARGSEDRYTARKRIEQEQEIADAKAKADAIAKEAKDKADFEAKKALIDQKYTAKDRARKAQLDSARAKIEADTSLDADPKRKEAMLKKIDEELLGIKPVETELSWPKKQDKGQIWELTDPKTEKGTGTWLSRDEKGNPFVVHKAESMKPEKPEKIDYPNLYKMAERLGTTYDKDGKPILPDMKRMGEIVEDLKAKMYPDQAAGVAQGGTGQPPPPPPPPAGPPISDPEIKKLYDRKKAGGILTDEEEEKIIKFIQKIESEMGM